MAREVIFAEQTLEFTSGANEAPGQRFFLTTGKTYTVVWDGTEYTVIAKDYSEGDIAIPVLGNTVEFGGGDTGEPFLFFDAPPESTDDGIWVSRILTQDTTSASHTVAIYAEGTGNVLADLFADIADAIREKNGNTATMKPAEFPDRIRAIETGDGEGVDLYYRQLAETVMNRDAKYLGDAAVLEMKGFKMSDGNVLASLMNYSFAGFSKTEGMLFSDVVMAYENSLRDCTKLRILDMTASTIMPTVNFMSGSLNGCAALEAIIIRDGGAGINNCLVNSANGANDTFYVYVPSEFYDEIIANVEASASCIPSSRYRKLEDYPEINFWNEK